MPALIRGCLSKDPFTLVQYLNWIPLDTGVWVSPSEVHSQDSLCTGTGENHENPWPGKPLQQPFLCSICCTR